MSKKENTKNTAYILGEIFAVYEAVHNEANKCKTGIGGNYFNLAMTTPAGTFATLTAMYHANLRKFETTRQEYFDNQVTELMDAIDGDRLPERLLPAEQGNFDLGYYHQKALLKNK